MKRTARNNNVRRSLEHNGKYKMLVFNVIR